MNLNLPESVLNFLKDGRQFTYDPSECEAGLISLNQLDQLILGEVWIGTEDESDPHQDEDGYYSVPAVSLTGECEAYDPEYILLWLPNEQLFGSWDCDHWKLTVFPGTSWEDIVADPLIYLNAQWSPDGVGSEFHPWSKYEFREGRPF